MVAIPLGNGDWESQSQTLPRIRLRNMYITQNPSSIDGITRISRPTLKRFYDLPTDEPVKGVWSREGIFNEDYFAVAGETFYRVANDGQSHTVLGEIPGTGLVEFTSRTETSLFDTLLLVRDGVAYLYQESDDSFTPVEMPDDRQVLSVASINNYFILTILNAQQFFWMNPGELTVNALNFASAERNPDNILSVKIVGDEIWFISREGPEVWTSILNIDPTIGLPFQRINGRVYKEGCISRDTVVNMNFRSIPAVCWLTTKGAVVMAQGVPTRISNESIEELLRNATNIRCWTFRYNRHDFYVISTDQFGLAFDIDNQTWMRWDSQGENYWRAHLGSQIDSDIIAGDAKEGILWQLEEGFSDDGTTVVRELAGFLPHSAKPTQINDVYANLNSGWSPTYDLEPKLELRWSDDQGATFSPYLEASLGTRGEYGRQVIFRSLGLLRAPGRLFEFRFSEEATLRFDYAVINEIRNS